MATTITVDRPTRDVLRPEVLGELYELDELLQNAVVSDPRKARPLRVLANYREELLDALGWDEGDDRNQFELRADRVLAGWLKAVQTGVEHSPLDAGETLFELDVIDRLRGELDELIGAVA